MTGLLSLAGCGGGGGSPLNDGVGPTVAVAGQIDIEANTRVDIDTADKLGGVGAYLGTGNPQLLPASVILGGYVSNESGTRDPADPYDNYYPDPVDRYQLTLNGGDRVELQTFYTEYRSGSTRVPANYPVSITLRQSSDKAVLDSAQTSPGASVPVYSASVSVPAGSGTASYYVDIDAVTGPMRYVLTSSPSGAATSLNFDWPRYEFANDEALVSFSDAGSVRTLAAAGSARPVRALGKGAWLMRRTGAQVLSASRGPERTAGWIRQLRQQPSVVSATPNYTVRAQTATTEPLYPEQWHYPLISAPAAWQLAPSGGAGVRVAVVDTGLFLGANRQWHPDLNANVPPVGDATLTGSDFVSQSSLDNDGDNPTLYGQVGRDNIPADPGSSIGTNVFHGTHVAGTIAAVGDNNIGGTGVAFNASLLPVRVLGEGGTGTLGDLIDGLNWIGSGNRAQIVNLSLGGLPYDQRLEDALKGLSDRNIAVVAAAGNSATSTKQYPAASPYVFAVSAVDGASNLAPYSNFGNWIDIAAPGGSAADANLDGQPDFVLSTSASLGSGGSYEPGYRGLIGTSMAAPHVSGVLALMKGIDSTITLSQLRAWLIGGELTRDGSGPRNDQFGYGILDAAKAAATALTSPSVTVLSPEPYYVSLNDLKTSATVTLTAIGDTSKPVSGCSVGATPTWLNASCDPNSSPATLSVSLTNASRLDPDVPLQTAVTVTYITDAQRMLDIPVTAQVVTDAKSRSAGMHFVLLVQTEPDAQGNYITEAQDVVQLDNGHYTFRFRHDDGVGSQAQDEVRPGTYFLVAGTDLDNDGYICQSGEACAEYPVSGLRESIRITQDTDLTNLRMTTGFSRPTISVATPDVLPRPGFTGYSILKADGARSSVKQLSGGQ